MPAEASLTPLLKYFPWSTCKNGDVATAPYDISYTGTSKIKAFSHVCFTIMKKTCTLPALGAHDCCSMDIAKITVAVNA